ncbi:hypothetical protein Patl1_32723 [Pistacia atlantica]|uniref:Uncharacterized protein n=1 Tax=Pistacia atlantica TaxID=434234 RepID=A0ACC1AN48_9ROSI|nr:hypothetical protein Patl1_32723 [Pistacia atlantica]
MEKSWNWVSFNVLFGVLGQSSASTGFDCCENRLLDCVQAFKPETFCTPKCIKECYTTSSLDAKYFCKLGCAISLQPISTLNKILVTKLLSLSLSLSVIICNRVRNELT